jgi:hypothetical protein
MGVVNAICSKYTILNNPISKCVKPLYVIAKRCDNDISASDVSYGSTSPAASNTPRLGSVYLTKQEAYAISS